MLRGNILYWRVYKLAVVGVRTHGAETSIIPPHSFSYMCVLIIISSEAVCINSCVEWTSVGFV